MNNLFKALLGICLIPALFHCSDKQSKKTVMLSDLPTVEISAELNSMVEIKNWLAIGPFEFQPLLTDPLRTFSRKDLKRYGIMEGSIDENGIKKLQKRGINVFLIEEESSMIRLFKYVFKKIVKKSNFYLVAKIHSEYDNDVTLITDGSYSYSIWLNGNKLIEETGKLNTNKVGDKFVNVSLKEGENILFAKVNRGTNLRSWNLICAISPRGEAEKAFKANYSSDFVINPLIKNSIEIYAGQHTNGRVEILDNSGQIVAETSFENQNTNDKILSVSNLKKLEEGFYKAVLKVGAENLEQMFYKGDYNKFVKKIKLNVDEIQTNSAYSKDLKAAFQRVKYMNEKPGDPNSPSETRFINRNKVFWGYALHKMLQKDAKTQLMTYESNEENYGIFIFHNANKQQQNTPLVIIVPSALQGNSMIEDWYTSNLDQIETDNSFADELGFAVAWIYAGGWKYSAENTQKEIDEIINRLSKEYNIDSKKIFIMGDCEGGRRALLQLAATPETYAACALSAPLTLYGIDGAPINLLSSIGNTPIYIKHGTDDETSPVENSRRFYDEARKLNMPVEFNEVLGSHASVSKGFHKDMFDFFSQIESK